MASASRVWVLAAATLAPGTLLAGSVAAMTLDSFVQRPPGAGSITTLLPGFTYAAATVMKVSLVAGVVSAIVAVATRVLGSAPAATGVRGRSWALVSTAMAPTALLAGTLAVLIAQDPALSVRDFTYVSRGAVFVQLWTIGVGAVAAAVSLIGRERPRPLAVLGLIVHGLLIGLFWSLQFYAVGFDQDTWAPR